MVDRTLGFVVSRQWRGQLPFGYCSASRTRNVVPIAFANVAGVPRLLQTLFWFVRRFRPRWVSVGQATTCMLLPSVHTSHRGPSRPLDCIGRVNTETLKGLAGTGKKGYYRDGEGGVARFNEPPMKWRWTGTATSLWRTMATIGSARSRRNRGTCPRTLVAGTGEEPITTAPRGLLSARGASTSGPHHVRSAMGSKRARARRLTPATPPPPRPSRRPS